MMCEVSWSIAPPETRVLSGAAGKMRRMMPSWSVAMRKGKSVAAKLARVEGATTKVGVPRS
jgi:hypothetical protein